MKDEERHVQRWPRHVYGVGEEPDPRFTLANERTFLAQLRTSLALMAAGVGLRALAVSAPDYRALAKALAIALLVMGMSWAAMAFGRWAKTERALRTGGPLPPPRIAPLLSYGLALVGLVAIVLVVGARV